MAAAPADRESMDLAAIPTFASDDVFHVVVEAPRGSTLKLKYEREYVLGETLFTLDFYVADHRLGIEVDGSIHDPGKPDQAKRIQHAERKAAICRCMGIKLIRIHHSELRGDDLSAVIAKIEEIAGKGEPAKGASQLAYG